MKLLASTLLVATLAFSTTTSAAFSNEYDITQVKRSSFAYGTSIKVKDVIFNVDKDSKSSLPVTISDANIKAESGEVSFTVSKPIQAIEFTTILFDVFGRQINAFTCTEVKDFEADKTYTISAEYTPTESRYATSFTYVSNVRISDSEFATPNFKRIEIAYKTINLGR
tara:strand:+ start:460 stop:963 length:504 start_codon:yes stop_codon:yes gene_type:complete